MTEDEEDAQTPPASHAALWAVCKGKAEYFGREQPEEATPDCSCGCKFFHPLEGDRGMDWGVCWNQKSPRAGLLTFEHIGCKEYEHWPEEDEEDPLAPGDPHDQRYGGDAE